MFFKNTYKLIPSYQMPTEILFIFKKRLNFIYLTSTLLLLLII